MSLFRLLVPALAIAGSASAVGCSGKITIRNQVEATQVAGCSVYSGDVTIDPKTTGDISFDGALTRIKGSFTADHCGLLTSLSASSLQTIDNTMFLYGLANLTSMNFNVLTSVTTLDWQTLPDAISSTTLTSGLRQCQNLKISDTKFTSLSGIQLATASVIEIANNAFIKSINMAVKTVTAGIIINANGFIGAETSVAFDSLVSTGTFIANNASSVSISALKNVTKSIAFTSGSFSTLSAPKLQAVGSLTVVDNPAVHSLSFPVLSIVQGALNVQNNTQLTGTIAFPALTYIKGAALFLGSFNKLLMPKLKRDTGGMIIATTAKSMNCGVFNGYHNAGIILGSKYTCQKGQTKKAVGEGNGSSGGKSSSSSKKNAAGHSQVSAATLFGASGALAAAFALLV